MTSHEISILHIGPDEKFINAANYIFEKAFPGKNRFIITHSRLRSALTYVTIESNVEVLHYGSKLVDTISNLTNDFDCVIIHGVSETNSSIFLASKDKDKFIGMLWGAELYTEENFPGKGLLGELTASIEMPDEVNHFKDRMKNIIRQIVYYRNPKNTYGAKEAFMKLKYIGSIDFGWLDFFKGRNLISDKCIYIPFTYYPLEFIVKELESTLIGNDILLGNSASFTNNHMEAFEILKAVDIGKRKIIVPLSYGNAVYADFVQEKGHEYFNENFIPIRKFMPLADYNKEMRACGITIMNHYRSQAVGNIFAMLWFGSKVYLNKSNSFYFYLKSIGIKVFSIEDDLIAGNKKAFDNLSMEEIENNRRILRKEIGEDTIVANLRASIFEHFK